jgi:hypothetical protein
MQRRQVTYPLPLPALSLSLLLANQHCFLSFTLPPLLRILPWCKSFTAFVSASPHRQTLETPKTSMLPIQWPVFIPHNPPDLLDTTSVPIRCHCTQCSLTEPLPQFFLHNGVCPQCLLGGLANFLTSKCQSGSELSDKHTLHLKSDLTELHVFEPKKSPQEQ